MLGKDAHKSQMPLSLLTHGEKSLVLIPASTLFATRRILLSRCDFWIVFLSEFSSKRFNFSIAIV